MSKRFAVRVSLDAYKRVTLICSKEGLSFTEALDALLEKLDKQIEELRVASGKKRSKTVPSPKR